jgi:hypothetical protein
MSVNGYDHPNPPLPDEPGVRPEVKLILEMYADEIREHASSMIYIYGMNMSDATRYKYHCFAAADHLYKAAESLRMFMASKSNLPK